MYLNQENGTDWVHHWSRWREWKTPLHTERTQFRHGIVFFREIKFQKSKGFILLWKILSQSDSRK